MRILVVRPGPNFSVEDVATGWIDALETLGHEVRDFDLSAVMTYHEISMRANGGSDDRLTVSKMAAGVLRQTCFDWWPDLLLIVSAFFVPPETYEIIRARGIKVAVLLTESPYEDDNQISIAKRSDLAVVNDPTNIARFPSNTIYLPHAYNPKIHHPQEVSDPDVQSDFCFVGTGYPSRQTFLEAVDWTGIDCALAGNWRGLNEDSPLRKYVAHDIEACCANDWTAQLYAGTKASANIYRTEAQRDELSDGWAMGPREVELAACGTFYLTQPRGENRQVLPMVPTFTDPSSFEITLRWYLEHPKERQQIAKEAQAAIADRTFVAHALDLLDAL